MHLTPNNPLFQFIHALTDWLVKPLSKLVAPSRTNWPALIAGVLVAVLVTVAFFLLSGHTPEFGPVLLRS